MSDGALAPMHLLAGLPREWVVTRGDSNEVLAVKATVIAGFLHAGTVLYPRSGGTGGGAALKSRSPAPLFRSQSHNPHN